MEVQRVMAGHAGFVVALGNTIEAFFSVAALFLVFGACWCWHNFRASRKMLLMAWFFSLAGPFVSSLMPARLFVDWHRGQLVTSQYTKELMDVTNLEDKMLQLRKGCYMVQSEDSANSLGSVENTMKTICGVVHHSLPSGNVSIPTSITLTKWKTIDFSFAHSQCDQTKRFIEQKLATRALDHLRMACTGLKEMVGGGVMNLDSEQGEQIANDLASWMGLAAESTICLWLSLQGFMTTFPVALSIAPGMLKGALRMKILVPQSKMPGMFVLMLPWLYAPVAWCYYSIFFQIVGSPLLLLGLLIIAFHPVLYSVLGMRWGVSHPMTDKQVLKLVSDLNGTVLKLIIVGVIFIVIYLAYIGNGYASRKHYWGYFGSQIGEEDWAMQMEYDIWQVLLGDRKILIDWAVVHKLGMVLAAVLTKYFLTSVAGFDWIVGQMLKFRAAETKVMGGDKESQKIADEYTNRIDQLVALDKNIALHEND